MNRGNNSNSALASSRAEFEKKCRRISIKNLPPPGVTSQDISDLLKPYHYQQIYIDKMSLSCKAVLLDGESACRCMKDLNMKMYRGSRLIVSLASCDFMLCVTQLPPMYTREQFLTLITPFGTAERCFLVHSETNGQSKGYGCVEFTSKESSIKAKNHLNGKTIGPYTLQVHWLDAIPRSYTGLNSCCLFIENLPNSHRDANSLRDLFTHGNVTPVFYQSANCIGEDFSIIEYSTSDEAEKVWLKMDNLQIGGKAIRVTFCVPGPCGLVVLNSLKASRDLKRNNPSGGLLPTPVPKRDPLPFQLKANTQAPTASSIFSGNLVHATTHRDPEVLRLLKALQVRLHNMPDSNVSQTHIPDLRTAVHAQAAQLNRQIFDDARINSQGNDASNSCHISNLAITTLSQPRGRSASYDSGVQATDDEVFSSGSSSQEDVGRLQEGSDKSVPFFRSGMWNALSQPQVDHPSAFSQISSESNRSHLNHRPVVLPCPNDLELQRSDSADSAYGGSQESGNLFLEQPSVRKSLLQYPFPNSKPFHLNGLPMIVAHVPRNSNCEQYQRPFPRRLGENTNTNCGTTHSDCSNMALNDVPRPEFLFSSLCKKEELFSKAKDSMIPIGAGSSFTQHRSHLVRTPLRDQSPPCFRNKTSFSGLMADLHDIGADSPTQLQLLGSSLMEGLLADSPGSSIDPMSNSVNGSSGAGRLLRALNLFSPTECLNSPHTPASARKRVGDGMLQSPEPSPEAGAYVGQHSQGLGGHYYAGSPPIVINLHKRRKSNET